MSEPLWWVRRDHEGEVMWFHLSGWVDDPALATQVTQAKGQALIESQKWSGVIGASYCLEGVPARPDAPAIADHTTTSVDVMWARIARQQLVEPGSFVQLVALPHGRVRVFAGTSLIGDFRL